MSVSPDPAGAPMPHSWVMILEKRLAAGEDPVALFGEYMDRVREEEARERMVPIPARDIRIIRAFEGTIVDGRCVSDWDALDRHGALTDDRTLTPAATRTVLDGWAAIDRMSRHA